MALDWMKWSKRQPTKWNLTETYVPDPSNPTTVFWKTRAFIHTGKEADRNRKKRAPLKTHSLKDERPFLEKTKESATILLTASGVVAALFAWGERLLFWNNETTIKVGKELFKLLGILD